MASLDSIAPDQRAVLQLVLQRGRSYDEIAQILSIDRAGVRQRALSAFDALGPQTGVDEQRRALITDYLLGQLPPAVAQQTRDRLARSPSERAWARVVASELAPIASKPLPEIPSGVAAAAEQPAAQAPVVAVAADSEQTATALGQPASPAGTPRSSRIGGIVLIGVAAVAAVVVAVVLLTSGGSSKTPTTASGSTKPSAAASSSTTTSSSSSAAHVVAQINLTAPMSGSKTAGIAEVLKEGANKGIAIVADHVTPNTTRPPNAYAVWLYNSSSDAQLLGFVNPGVGKNGRLSTAGGLPSNAANFHQVIITLETKADPKTPGTIVLHGALSGLS
jgi:Sigma-70, region 4